MSLHLLSFQRVRKRERIRALAIHILPMALEELLWALSVKLVGRWMRRAQLHAINFLWIIIKIFAFRNLRIQLNDHGTANIWANKMLVNVTWGIGFVNHRIARWECTWLLTGVAEAIISVPYVYNFLSCCLLAKIHKRVDSLAKKK